MKTRKATTILAALICSLSSMVTAPATLAHTPYGYVGDVQGSDFSGVVWNDLNSVALVLPDVSTGPGAPGGDFVSNPGGFIAKFNQSLGNFQNSMSKMIAMLTGLKTALAPTPEPKAGVFLRANAQQSPKLGDGLPASMSSAANQVTASGKELSDFLVQLMDDKKQVNPIVVGPASKAADSMRQDVSGVVKELRAVPVKQMDAKQLAIVDEAVDDTDDLLASLEKIVPMLSKIGKKINAANK